jgi:D-alanyl-D-alanine dipeptidase
MKTVLIWLIKGYKLLISPILPPSCRFYPSCSQYALEAIARFGALKGTSMALCRIVRCNPFHPGGVDPVPTLEEMRQRRGKMRSRGSMQDNGNLSQWKTKAKKRDRSMKPYQKIPIQECHEPLVPIPLEQFAVESPHPYVKLGVDYQGKSPYYLRQGVLNALQAAQKSLQQNYPGWRISIFDAYRPIAVQQFMVDYTFQSLLRERKLNLLELSSQQQEQLWQEVYQFWAVPSDNPATPPPHSTGAAIDITLVNARGEIIDMGSPIDEVSARSHPYHYQNPQTPAEKRYHQNREILNQAMTSKGFCRHPKEWWHFSLGDQIWALQYNQKHPESPITARYGQGNR